MKTDNKLDKSENRDPLTGEPGSHPVGTGLGSAGGAAAGAAMGAVGGPVGVVVGGVIGAIAGAAAGHSVAEGIDPTAEDAYWKENHQLEPYFIGDYDYNDYRPAYRMGYEGYGQNKGRSFEEVEPDLANKWEDTRESSRLGWGHARHAVQASWHRAQNSSSGRTDRTGY